MKFLFPRGFHHHFQAGLPLKNGLNRDIFQGLYYKLWGGGGGYLTYIYTVQYSDIKGVPDMLILTDLFHHLEWFHILLTNLPH